MINKLLSDVTMRARACAIFRERAHRTRTRINLILMDQITFDI